MAIDNKSLGRFILDGIPPAPRGMPQIEVTFDIDANGILQVKAKDKSSGKEQSIKVEASSGLTDADIARMKQDADVHAEEDRKKKEVAEARNLAEQLIYTAEKSLKDAEGKITDEIKIGVQEKIDALKKIKDGTDANAIKKATEELSQEMQKIGEYMSKHAPQGSGKGNVRDAKAEDVKKDDTDMPEKNI